MGSVKTAMFLVDGFYDETMYITRDLGEREKVEKALKEMARRKDKTISELQTIRWVDEPGRNRYDKIFKIVNGYSDAQIETVQKLREESSDKRQIYRIIRTLKALKKKKLKTLRGTLKYETYRGKRLRPVPIVDKSPFESGGKTGTGGEIWFR